MTREIYTHVTDTMLQEATDAIERVMGGEANGSNGGPNNDHEPENDEGQEPGYGA